MDFEPPGRSAGNSPRQADEEAATAALRGAPAGPTSRLAVAAATLATLAVAAAGAALFAWLGAPAAFLTGSAVAVLAAMALKMPARLPDALRNGTFTVLGAMLGSGVSLAALEALLHAPTALLGLVLTVAGATAAGFLVLRRFGGWDAPTSLCGAVPGNFSVVMVVALESGANVERVVLAQALRLFILVAIIPFALGSPAAGAFRAPASAGLMDMGLTLALAFAAAWLANRLKFPAPTFLGPLIAAVAVSASGLFTIAVPSWLAAGTFVVLGASIAVRFNGVRREGLGRVLAASLLSFLAALAVVLAVTALVAALLPIPFGALFLAYAPGGLDAMVAMTFLLHYDVAFVAVAHSARMIILAVAVPILVARVAAPRQLPPA